MVRVAVGLGVALALLLALVREGDTFTHSLAVASLAVGAVTLLMAFAGGSPGMRGGTIDPWLTSFSARLWPELAKPYAHTTLSASALLGLVGLALLGLGALLL